MFYPSAALLGLHPLISGVQDFLQICYIKENVRWKILKCLILFLDPFWSCTVIILFSSLHILTPPLFCAPFCLFSFVRQLCLTDCTCDWIFATERELQSHWSAHLPRTSEPTVNLFWSHLLCPCLPLLFVLVTFILKVESDRDMEKRNHFCHHCSENQESSACDSWD